MVTAAKAAGGMSSNPISSTWALRGHGVWSLVIAHLAASAVRSLLLWGREVTAQRGAVRVVYVEAPLSARPGEGPLVAALPFVESWEWRLVGFVLSMVIGTLVGLTSGFFTGLPGAVLFRLEAHQAHASVVFTPGVLAAFLWFRPGWVDPPVARENNWEGLVRLRMLFSANGRLASLSVTTTSGVEVAAAIVTRTAMAPAGDATPENIAAVGGNTQAIGQVLFSDYLLGIEIIIS